MPTKIMTALVAAIALWTAACAAPPYLPIRQGGEAESQAAKSAAVVHETEVFEGVGGTKLFGQSWRPREAARATLVIVHGLKDHGSRYAAFAETCAERGFAVYALDLRGHAHSEGVRVYIDSFDEYLSDVAIYVERVRAKESGRPLFLFGHSMGGAIVTLLTIAQKPAVAGVVLSGAALEVDVSGIKVLGTKMVAALAPKAQVFELDLDQFSRDPEVVRAAKADPLVYQDAAPARTARELLRAIDEIGEHMEEVTVPILILHGGADRVTPPEGSRELEARARSKDKTLRIYDGLVHDLLHEPEKARVTTDVVDWLSARAPVPAPAAKP